MVILFISNRFPVELVAIAAALTLYGTGVLELSETLVGFGDPAVILIASLFVVSEGLDATGVTTWAGQQLMARLGEGGRPRLVTLLLSLVALLTALISVNGAVAALIPMAVIVGMRTETPTSQLLMPLAFGAHAGSMLALTGTPVNVLVSDAAIAGGSDRFAFFSFALVGVPLVIGTIAVVALFGPKLLPNRTPKTLPPDLSIHARTLGLQYLRDRRVFRLLVSEGSTCVGVSDDAVDLSAWPGAELVGVQTAGEGQVLHTGLIGPGDVLIVRGVPSVVRTVADALHLSLERDPFAVDDDGELITRQLGVAEVVVAPRSELIGVSVFPGMVTDSGDLVILSVQRKGEDLETHEVTLASGDTLLVQGEWQALDLHIGSDPDVLMVDDPARVRRQAVPLGPRSTPAIAIVAVMVVVMATGVMPTVVAGLLAAGAMVLLRVLTTEQAYRGISWTTVVLVGAMIPLSTAMTKSGAADQVATRLVDAVGGASPYLLLLGLFALTAVLGQLISNMATALVVIPIAVSAAADLGVSPRPVLMCVTVAAAAALLTPVATPANLMVMGPGGYKFGDYWKLGLPLLLLYGLVAVVLVPQIWSF